MLCIDKKIWPNNWWCVKLRNKKKKLFYVHDVQILVPFWALGLWKQSEFQKTPELLLVYFIYVGSSRVAPFLYGNWARKPAGAMNNITFQSYMTIISRFPSNVQNAKKVMSDSPGLVDFAIGLVNSVLNLPDRQAKIFLEN